MIDFTVDNEALSRIAGLDRFQGRWAAARPVPAPRLRRLAEAARVRSVAASGRLAGLRVSDAEVAALLRGDDPGLREAPLLLGYASAIDHPLPGSGALLTLDDLCRLNAVILAGSADEPCPLRGTEMLRETFDAEGRALGRVFTTIPPHLVQAKTEELLTWYEYEMRSGERHPVLTIAGFLLMLLAISPFPQGNGRLTRLLAGRLLLRAGYEFIPYGSLEAEMEALREKTYDAFDEAQLRLWSGAADSRPWLATFLEICERHRRRVEARVDLERRAQQLPPLQLAILEAVREHGTVDARLLIEATGANRNTLKDNLRRLVDRGVLERTGQRRGARYRLA